MIFKIFLYSYIKVKIMSNWVTSNNMYGSSNINSRPNSKCPTSVVKDSSQFPIREKTQPQIDPFKHLQNAAIALGLPDLCSLTLKNYQYCAGCKKKYGNYNVPILLLCSHLICQQCYEADSKNKSLQNIYMFRDIYCQDKTKFKCPNHNAQGKKCNKIMKHKTRNFSKFTVWQNKILESAKQEERFKPNSQQFTNTKVHNQQSQKNNQMKAQRINSVHSEKTINDQFLNAKNQNQKVSQFQFVIKNIEGDIKILKNLDIQTLTLQMLILQHAKPMIRNQQVSSIQQIYIDGKQTFFSYQKVKKQKVMKIVKLSKEKINEVIICKRYVGGITILIN